MKTAESRNPWLVLLVVCVGSFLILLNSTIVNVAIPTILSSLNAGLDQILWVVNAYLLTFAVLILVGARLGDLFGQRNVFATGLAIFSVAAALSGLAQDANELIATQVLMGVGAALLAPQPLVIVSAVFPAQRRGAAIGILSAITGLAALAGPTLGGLIVTNLDWRWVFFVLVPVGVLGLALAFLLLPDLRPDKRQALDLVGVGLASAGLFGVVFGLIEGQRYDWGAVGGSSVTIPEIIGGGLLVLAAFLVWERFQAAPLMPLSIFRNRNFSIMTWLNGLLFFALFGLLFTTTIDLQSVLGMSAVQAGLTTIPLTVMLIAVAPLAGRLTDLIGSRYILMVGFLLLGAGIAAVAFAESVTADSLTFVLPLVLTGLGMGMVIAPVMTEAMREMTPVLAGTASGILNTTRQLGSAVGVAIVGAVLQNQLSAAMHDRAVADSAQLPSAARAGFVKGVDNAARAGLQVGRGQSGGFHLPAGLPPQVAHQMQELIHDVFVNGYATAMRPTLAVAAAAVLLGALTCIFIVRRPSPAGAIQLESHPLVDTGGARP
ncbi:MAG TPA: DHA2 family efflux MFS transporter permease subunit [Candidatus Dormibacteraeota bacterium]|nr:DHA2 family efflux MFS transporter permease subunit [Candidatus Dormibacteraeota bacterium]